MLQYLKKLFLISIISLFSVFLSINSVLNASDENSEIISSKEAAEYAAKLANEKCSLSYKNCPFKPESYIAKLVGSKWHWGFIDVAGINGFSAKVEFNKNGSEPNIEVKFHIDTNTPKETSVEKTPIPLKISP